MPQPSTFVTKMGGVVEGDTVTVAISELALALVAVGVVVGVVAVVTADPSNSTGGRKSSRPLWPPPLTPWHNWKAICHGAAVAGCVSA